MAALFALLAGVGMLVIFQRQLAAVDPATYRARDDAVITLSHARNLIDFGFIGVNPSGERVEGFSAPLQFALYAVAYALTHMDYQLFFAVQTAVTSAALGALFYLLFELLGPHPLRSLALTLFCAKLLTCSASFLLWHHSGMEGSLGHALYLGCLAALILATREAGPRRWMLPLFLCAAWVRDESILHIAPLLLLLIVVRRDRAALRFTAELSALWLGVFWCKAAYFGDIQPNTAYAQLLSPGGALIAMLQGELPLSRFQGALTMLGQNLALLPLVFLPLLRWTNKSRALWLILGAFALMAASGLAQGLLFGPARMDPPRTTTFVAVFAVLAAGALIAANELPAWLRVALALALISPPVAAWMPKEPYTIGWAAGDFELTRLQLENVARDEELKRPTLANVDLGAISYAKHFNVVDLGFLGSDVLAKLDSTADTADYILEIAQPDLIRLNGHWACLYWFLEADPRFAARYEPLRAGRGPFLIDHCAQHPEAKDGLWIRRAVRQGSATPERRLIDDLSSTPAAPRLRTELAACAPLGTMACGYVLHTAYRFLPELRSNAQEEAVLEAFQALPEGPFRAWALALLRSRKNGQLKGPALALIEATRQSTPTP